ncbi:DUF6385 domain-containing protein [Desulfofalx alkaliphila]|uniref:DUF6385 domain-containing protein n=1 Tax=Desulfofalx alkaliphila TaxID=105483 RepID=UPI0004E258EB|nr:DUF6385 domain-containing protein [Desulfofalx alkaliphila]
MKKYIIPAERDTFIVTREKEYTACHSPYLLVGAAGRQKFYSYIYFRLSSIPSRLSIISAKLNLYFDVPPYKGRPPSSLILKLLKDGFCDCKTKYFNRPNLLAEPQKNVPIPKDFSMVSIDVTDIINKWRLNGAENIGFALLPDRCHSNGVIVINSIDGIDDSLVPSLTVDTIDPGLGLICRADNFKEKRLVTVEEKHSSTREVWHYSIFSYIVKNIGTKKVIIQLQNSPDGINFIDEEPAFLLKPGQTDIFVNTFFARFGRLKYKLSPGEDGLGKIKIWLQGKGNTFTLGNIG